MARVFYRQNPKGQTEVLRSPGGPVAKHLLRLGNLTQRYAREQAGKRTGRLAASIKVQLTAKATGLAVKVGSDNKIAYLHHEGSRPHIIRAKNVAYLRFYSHGKLRFAKSVRHPGTRANPYLQRSMALAIGRIH
jgi:hypothetical protein